VSGHTFDGPRGLNGYLRFTDSYGGTVEIQESSAVIVLGEGSAMVDLEGQGNYAWLRVYIKDWEPGRVGHASAHIDTEMARWIIEALEAFIKDVEGGSDG
jgi:hypothetical protein